MKLTIITINYNNATGLHQTMESVLSQNVREFEYIVIDGASTDNSVAVIESFDTSDLTSFQWISEPDNGIYHAMNKGIQLAQGEYLQFLNSGDMLVQHDATLRMLSFLEKEQANHPESVGIVYGNMLKPVGTRLKQDKGFAGRTPSLLDFFTGTLNHSPSYIHRSLFEEYGLYDENLRIVSDWKWFLQVIILYKVEPLYADIDVTLFDMTGISSVNQSLDREERKQVLSKLFPGSILRDYEEYAFAIEQWNRMNRYLITRKLLWWMERGLFKWEKLFR